jgi:hypothetical protein
MLDQLSHYHRKDGVPGLSAPSNPGSDRIPREALKPIGLWRRRATALNG